MIAVPPESPLQKFEDIKGQEVYFQKAQAYYKLWKMQAGGFLPVGANK